MIDDFSWYLICNANEFYSMNLFSKEFTVNLEGIGVKTVIVYRGQNLSIEYEGVLLSVSLNGRNPFVFDGFAVYINSFDNVFLGVPVEN